MYSTTHLLFTWHGVFGPAATEEWSWGVRCTSGSLTLPNATETLNQLAAKAETLGLGYMANVCGQPAYYTHTKVAVITGEGHYPEGLGPGLKSVNPPANIGNGAAYPFQVALAVTTTTQLARGKACRGRWFLPTPKFFTGPDGRITAADATTVANSSKTFLNGLKTLSTAYALAPAVFSVGPTSEAAHHELITGVRVGRVPDTMRSRRRSLLEEPVTLAL